MPRNTSRTIQTVFDATEWLCETVRFIGPGFHPDTPMDDYIHEDGSRSFNPAEALSLQSQLDQACDIVEAVGIDPCEICLPVQRQLLRFA